MKTQLTYDSLTFYASRTAERLSKVGDIELVAICRGGLTYAQAIAYKMALPLSIFYPTTNGWSSLAGPATQSNKPLVFIEDVIAKGRTYNLVNSYMRHNHPNRDWCIAPLVVDFSIDLEKYPRISHFGFQSLQWVVFPHEDMNHVAEGDHGMFRDGTSNNSQPVIKDEDSDSV